MSLHTYESTVPKMSEANVVPFVFIILSYITCIRPKIEIYDTNARNNTAFHEATLSRKFAHEKRSSSFEV